MDYEKMWNLLKDSVEKEYNFYLDGTSCSLMESVNGEIFCKSLIEKMKELEKSERE